MGNYATLKTLVTVLVEDKLDVNLAEEIIKYFKGKCKYYYTFVVTCNGSVQCWVYSIFETIYQYMMSWSSGNNFGTNK